MHYRFEVKTIKIEHSYDEPQHKEDSEILKKIKEYMNLQLAEENRIIKVETFANEGNTAYVFNLQWKMSLSDIISMLGNMFQNNEWTIDNIQHNLKDNLLIVETS